ncbi:uncharacterized protein LOC128259048 isoform X6 [Drosophila gunungcola]|uniref:uncharacterized protein LOC128259048 isoform X6 n=1 Tax=Drosophila gunungcola TaxID=103775 RepID=UPI0022E5812C|nr:uncharacterized protein LOC128259048 isoform X6 [Drosophila gunungcola]
MHSPPMQFFIPRRSIHHILLHGKQMALPPWKSNNNDDVDDDEDGKWSMALALALGDVTFTS